MSMKRYWTILSESLIYTLILIGLTVVYVLAETQDVNFIYNQF